MIQLSPRLAGALPFVKSGARLLDVGTDHAFLPIYLCENNLISEALATDINRGPIESADRHIAEAGLKGRIATRVADGLSGSEAFAPDTVIVFGMGGELIAAILDAAPWIRRESITLVLQSMSKQETLRRYLCTHGFTVRDESVVREGGRLYEILCASYTGENEPYTDAECLVGKRNHEKNEPIFYDLLDRKIAVLEKIVAAKKTGTAPDCRAEESLLCELQKMKGERK